MCRFDEAICLCLVFGVAIKATKPNILVAVGAILRQCYGELLDKSAAIARCDLGCRADTVVGNLAVTVNLNFCVG